MGQVRALREKHEDTRREVSNLSSETAAAPHFPKLSQFFNVVYFSFMKVWAGLDYNFVALDKLKNNILLREVKDQEHIYHLANENESIFLRANSWKHFQILSSPIQIYILGKTYQIFANKTY